MFFVVHLALLMDGDCHSPGTTARVKRYAAALFLDGDSEDSGRRAVHGLRGWRDLYLTAVTRIRRDRCRTTGVRNDDRDRA